MAEPRIGLILAGPSNEKFRITDFLGRGAFGEVYRAVGESSGAVVAVKLLPVQELEDDSSRVALLNEVKAAQQIVHPNVVQVLHVDEGSQKQLGPYVVMEYVSDGTLAELLKKQHAASAMIPMDRAMQMMIDIAQGARAINEKLIHRDIKPDNILIHDGRLKVSDFGISKFVDERTRSKTFKGGQALAYMAPEGWQGAKNTFKIDTYSVGLVFFEILTLLHPLKGRVKDPGDWRDWERAHLFEACPDVRELRADLALNLAQIVQRMTNKRPQDRPGWEEILQVLSTPTEIISRVDPIVTQAVEAAIKKHEEARRIELEVEEQARRDARKRELYEHSRNELQKRLKAVVEEFNSQFQHGHIRVVQEMDTVIFIPPVGSRLFVRSFGSANTPLRLRGGELIGGGLIGISQGRSANLVLVKEGEDDLYGRWLACEVNISALVDPAQLIGRYGITQKTITPFGFMSAMDFYDQIQYAEGIAHVFTYKFTTDIERFFAELLKDAVQYTASV